MELGIHKSRKIGTLWSNPHYICSNKPLRSACGG